ncbi:helix-turn-helix transcriptional regulator [Vagococcus sp. BWB3-3]|uniref:Helix-turn-helix transcriptional regulator n=1 Tax=Vagococcus allomyrinae TaxID=2794353 RepID=A0A940SX92_9ENTE|nr:helix-turn-helix domain-containing protein [Vagococcus allomyrinae]MBP1043016.1 helix-turn-helix transcriptional regulator [Vagococcus allomyrinae]
MYLNEFDATMQLIQGKWKIYLLYEIADNQIARFNQLSRSLPAISNKILTNQLRELEQDGLIQRKVFPEVPPRVEYQLTTKGHSIIPVLDIICQWGLAHVPAEELKEVLCDDV